MEQKEKKSKPEKSKKLDQSSSGLVTTHARGAVLTTEYGVMGYGLTGPDGMPIKFLPLCFESQSRAEGLAKKIANRSKIEHGVLFIPNFVMPSVFVGAKACAPYDPKDEIPEDGSVHRRTVRKVIRKRRNESRQKAIDEFMAKK